MSDTSQLTLRRTVIRRLSLILNVEHLFLLLSSGPLAHDLENLHLVVAVELKRVLDVLDTLTTVDDDSELAIGGLHGHSAEDDTVDTRAEGLVGTDDLVGLANCTELDVEPAIVNVEGIGSVGLLALLLAEVLVLVDFDLVWVSKTEEGKASRGQMD